MTAIAFLMTVLGLLIVRMFGCSGPEMLLGRYNKADYIGLGMFFVGIIMFIFVIAMWLWRVMP